MWQPEDSEILDTVTTHSHNRMGFIITSFPLEIKLSARIAFMSDTPLSHTITGCRMFWIVYCCINKMDEL